MKIVTLTDNRAKSDNLKTEHGLSIYIETEKHKILFDTGQSDAFISNANKLGINLTDVDTVIISHGHYDHLGGLHYFLSINKKAKVYLKKEIYDNQYISKRGNNTKQIGYPEELNDKNERFVFLQNEITEIDDIILIKNILQAYPTPLGNKILFKSNGNDIIHDDFKHELIFLIKEKNDIYLFSGCAHNGILNIMHTVKHYFPNNNIKMIFGGFHLIDKNEFCVVEDDNQIAEISKEIKNISCDAEIYTGHCTGDYTFQKIKAELGEQAKLFYTGLQINI